MLRLLSRAGDHAVLRPGILRWPAQCARPMLNAGLMAATWKRLPMMMIPVAGLRTSTRSLKGRNEKVFTERDRDSTVSTTSTTIGIQTGKTAQAATDNASTSALVSDLKTVKETFSGVPGPVMNMGLLGVLPYVVTSFSALYLSWDAQHAAHAQDIGLLVTPQTAHELLRILEPLQIGLGAVILSFLGAVHWGLEFAGYGGTQGYRRYVLGILPAILAWPTIFLPTDYALVTQFLGFTGMWFADNQATSWGWAPRWYTSYRFILTFLVGGCILVTLIVRGRLGADAYISSPGPTSTLGSIRQRQWQNRAEDSASKVSQAKVEGGAQDPEKDEKVIKGDSGSTTRKEGAQDRKEDESKKEKKQDTDDGDGDDDNDNDEQGNGGKDEEKSK